VVWPRPASDWLLVGWRQASLTARAYHETASRRSAAVSRYGEGASVRSSKRRALFRSCDASRKFVCADAGSWAVWAEKPETKSESACSTRYCTADNLPTTTSSRGSARATRCGWNAGRGVGGTAMPGEPQAASITADKATSRNAQILVNVSARSPRRALGGRLDPRRLPVSPRRSTVSWASTSRRSEAEMHP
jgi:hypothetical protein